MSKSCFAFILVVALTCSSFGSPDDGLVLHFSFDSSEGSRVSDLSGNGNNGVIAGAARFTPKGCLGGALEFDGVDDYVSVAASPSLNVTDQLTISAFFYPYSYSDQRPILNWVRRAPLKSGPQMWLHVRGYQWQGLGSGAHLCGADMREDILSRVISFADPPPNRWYHMAITYDRATGKGQIFLNGMLVKEQQMGSYELFTQTDLFIGAGLISEEGKPDPFFHGLIDDVRVYNRVVTSDEIVAVLRESKLGAEIPAGTGTAKTAGASTSVAASAAADPATASASAADGASSAAPTAPAAGGVVTTEKYDMTFIGFSDDPAGDEDVTDFYRNDSLYVRVHDVDLEGLGTNAGVRLLMYQENTPTFQSDLNEQTNGAFEVSVPLNSFQQGRVYVSVVGWNPKGVILRKDTEIFIHP